MDLARNADERAETPKKPEPPKDTAAERQREFEERVQLMVNSGCPRPLAADFLILQERVETLGRA